MSSRMRSADECDYAQLHKIYRAPTENETRYSPAKCIGCEMKEVSGRPDPKHVSTSFVERQNWTVRTNMRRYTRLSNGFQSQAGEPCGCHSPKLFRLQLHQDSSYTSHESSDGRWRHGSALERRGLGSPLGSLRAAEGGKSGVNESSIGNSERNRGFTFVPSRFGWRYFNAFSLAKFRPSQRFRLAYLGSNRCSYRKLWCVYSSLSMPAKKPK